jgi:subtilisin family serine protease
MNPTRITNLIVSLAFLFALLPARPVASAEPPIPELAPGAGYVPGEVIVLFDGGLKAKTYSAGAAALAARVGAQVVSRYGNQALLSFAPDADVPALVAQITALGGGVIGAQPNYIYSLPAPGNNVPYLQAAYNAPVAAGQPLQIPWEQLAKMRTLQKRGGRSQNIPTFPLELSSGEFWGWQRIHTDYVWKLANGKGVCLVDTGVDVAHPDFVKGTFLTGYDFVNDDALANDDNGHGTHLAGIIAASINKGDGSVLGVSNMKYLMPVKALNYQGWGTSYSIAAGIRYCANNTNMRVINLSITFDDPDPYLYLALDYAINGKGKFVVAAAGNDSTSAFRYPAAWADPSRMGKNFVGDVTNTISGGLVSVGAADNPDIPYWVDVDGDGDKSGDDEIFHECAALWDFQNNGGSNYGSWVQIVAPGNYIKSTHPVSYPFYQNYMWNDSPKYAWAGGTSEAAAFVSGAVADMLVRYPTLTNINSGPLGSIKSHLLDNSDSLAGLGVLASDTTPDPVIDPTLGYKNTSISYGLVGDEDQDWWDGVDGKYIHAPYCWPVQGGQFGAAQDMSNTRYLNLAGIMGYTAIYTELSDASNGMPLTGATVNASEILPLTNKRALRASAIVADNNTPGVILIGLPADNGQDYELAVNKKGYTSANVPYVTINDVAAGQLNQSPYGSIGVPPNNNRDLTIVSNWQKVDLNGDGILEIPDIDAYIWLPMPASEPGPPQPWGRIVGGGGLAYPGGNPANTPYIPAIDQALLENPGTLLAPALFGGTFSPYAMRLVDGGPSPWGPGPAETAVIRGLAVKTPLGLKPFYTGDYTILLTDYSGNYSSQNCEDLESGTYFGCQKPVLEWKSDASTVNPYFAYPVVRVWARGKIVGEARTEGQASCVGAGGLDWFKALRINELGITPVPDGCGDASILPYIEHP